MPAIDGYMGPRGLEDLCVAVVTQDDADGYAIGSLVRLEGAQAMQITPDFETTEQQYRDGKVKTSKIVGCQIQVTLGLAALESLYTVWGGNLTKSSTEAKWDFIKSSNLPTLYLVGRNAQLRDTANPDADAHYAFYRCSVESGNLGNLGQSAFAEPQITLYAEYTTNTSDFAGEQQLWQVLKQKTGSALSPVSRSSVGTSDTTAPTLSSSIPADAATGVATSATPTLTFSEAILFDATRFDLQKVNSATDIVSVSATFAYDGTDTVTCTPASALDATQEYQIVGLGIRDLAGNQMAAPVIVNFTTA